MTRVVVVGAGLAGLTAADELFRGGADVVVLEARDRVGGRTHGIEVAEGSWVDAGAAYLGDRHTELLASLASAGLKTTPAATGGVGRFALGVGGDGVGVSVGNGGSVGGEATSGPGRFPPLDPVALGEMSELLEALSDSVDMAAPWLTPDAGRLDSRTAADWAGEYLTRPDARLFFPLFLGEMMAADPADVSILHMAFYLRSGGGLRYLNAFGGGARQDRVEGGAHRLCEELAARLGDRVRLADPVGAVHQRPDGVSVHSESGTTRADAVVVAVPPLLADTIDFLPALPTSRAGSRTARGYAVKVHLVYPAPLWREQGLSGWSVSSGGPLLSTVDDSPESGVGVLTGFVTGSEARRFGALSAADRRAEVMAQMRRLFPELPEPDGFHVTDWVDEAYSRGCYAALFGPGDWIHRGPSLTRPHRRVHWAGAETSREFFGLMEGAIRSGHRAAEEILTAG